MTFQIITEDGQMRYAKDKNSVYIYLKDGAIMKVIGADPETFEVLDYPYAKDKNKSNWIFYRLTDIMLLKAEAITQTLLDGTDEASVATNETKLREAFTLVNAVNKRSVGQATLKDTLLFTNFSSKTQMTDLVYRERQRELMFEGKRWFDMVRRSMREGHTDYLTRETIKKHSANSSVVQNMLSKMDAIFWPYNIDELKVNNSLVQNPAFGSGEDDSYQNTAKK
jgi:hypothetical protein